MALSVVLDSDPLRLAEALARSLDEPLDDALAEDVLVVPSLGVGRWLQQYLARRDAVCARVTLEFPGRLLWRLLERSIPGLPSRSPFDPAIARWPILALLGELPAGPEFELLRAGLANASLAQRLERAGELALVFDRYLAYRRDWLESWTRGGWITTRSQAAPHEAWQRWLWRALLERLPGVSREHPFQTFRRLLEEERSRAPQGRGRLQERCGVARVRLFGLAPMAPEQFELYGALGQVFDVRWFAPDPCRDFWFDVVTTREAARVAAASPESAWLYSDEPSILGDWARAQRDFLVQLRQLEERFELRVDEDFRERPIAAPETDLAALQTSVLTRSDAPWAALAAGAGAAARDAADQCAIEVHSTHGPTRQVEVLHDRLLALFDASPDLRPDEVAVFCTDMESFAPRVQAVFAGAPPGLRIPFRISGNARELDPVARVTLDVLALCARPVGVEAVMELLGNAALALALGLDATSTDELRAALVAAGVHGDDATARAAIAPTPALQSVSRGESAHGWRAGIERLVFGAAVSADVGLLADRVPVRALSGRNSELLGQVLIVLDDIDVFRTAPVLAPVASWCALSQRWLEARFGAVPAFRDGWLNLRDALIELAQCAAAGAAPEVDVESFRLSLADALAAGAGSTEPTGALTVAALGSLRGVPFRVICVLGMDDGAWPRSEPQAEVDLMRERPRFGDRIARFDDRGSFLDALLAARERVLLFYCGHEARDNTGRQPATVLRELIGYVGRQRGSAFAVREHPLQAFAPAAFRSAARHADPGASIGAGMQGSEASFAAQWLDAARALAVPLAQRPSAPLVAPDALEPILESPPEVELRALVEVFGRPARLFLALGAGVNLPYELAPVRDDPPIGIDADSREVERALRELRSGADVARLRERLANHPSYPAQRLGEARSLAVVQEALRIDAVALRLEAQMGGAPDARERHALRVEIDGVAISGDIESIANGGVQLLVSAFRHGVRGAADAWLRHLLWQAAIEQDRPASAQSAPQTFLVCTDEVWQVSAPDSAIESLRWVLGWWRRVRGEALALFPRTCWAYLRSGGTSLTLAAGRSAQRGVAESDDDLLRVHAGALRAARGALEGAAGSDVRPERDEPWQEALWRGTPPPLEVILETGLALYAPLYAAILECKASPPRASEEDA